jgi:hypothetical protein
MKILRGTMCFVCICICQFTAYTALAQQPSLKQSLADLKKAFHPDKAFIMPFKDTTNDDLKAFLFSVQGTKGVTGTTLSLKNGKAVITVITKNSLLNVWNNMEAEIHNRYKVTDHTPDGFIIADSYQSK